MRRTTTGLLTAAFILGGGAVACSSSGNDTAEAKPSTVTATVTTTPSLSQAEVKSQCSDAIAEAAPGWDDWNFNPGEWQKDPRTPKVCLGLADAEEPTRGNRAFMGALLDGLGRADDPRAGQ